jgi:hypothetical protein
MRHLFGLIGIALAVFFTATPVVDSEATPVASPVASPVANIGCDGIGAYFQQVADLVVANDGMQMIPGTASSIASLSSAERAVIADDLTDLMNELGKIVPPAPAVAYHAAYIGLITWYRDLALATDVATWQQTINTDRRVARELGYGNYIGQETCGFAVWNRARESAFPS